MCSYVPLTETRSGKYLKRLIGRTDVEDALKRLDRLTNDEVRMATAQVLKVTHSVDDRVREVGNEVLDVDNKVAGVNDNVKAIDSKVTVAIDGTQPSPISQYSILMCLDGKRTRVVIQQVADDMGQVKRQ